MLSSGSHLVVILAEDSVVGFFVCYLLKSSYVSFFFHVYMVVKYVMYGSLQFCFQIIIQFEAHLVGCCFIFILGKIWLLIALALLLFSDGETFISADDLRINLWNLEVSNQSFNIVDVKPANMEDLTGACFLTFV